MENLGIPIVGIIVLGALLFVAAILLKNWTRARPDELVVLYGGKNLRYLSGGGKFKIPFIEKVARMSLAPFEIQETTSGVLSDRFVNVDIEWVSLVRFNAEKGLMEAAAERFLSSAGDEAGRAKIKHAITEILHAVTRTICANMTIEELNNDRAKLQEDITREVETRMTKLGIQLDAFSIQRFTDDADVIKNLGAAKAAEADRGARVAKANANKVARTAEAESGKDAETAEAKAATEIAQAERDRDVRIADLKAETDRQKAIAEQAGPLSDAEARKAVVEAKRATEAADEEGRIAVEKQTIEAQRMHLEGELVVRANAERDAAIAKADGEAEAIERLAEAQKVKAEADAFEIGEKLREEADGLKKLADARNTHTEAGLQFELTQKLYDVYPSVAAAIAAPVGNIDSITIVNTGGGNGSPMDPLLSLVPEGLAKLDAITRGLTGGELSKTIGKVLGAVESDSSDEASDDESELVSVAASAPADSDVSEDDSEI